MFAFEGSSVPVREDLRDAYIELWLHLSEPGPTLTGTQRVGLASYVRAARSGDTPAWIDLPASLLNLAAVIFTDPGLVDRAMVRAAADNAGDAMTVEAISIVAMLSAVDGAHRGLSADLEPLPVPEPGQPTRMVAEGLKQRRTHVPMPTGAINVAFDLLPDVGQVFQNSFGPQYMTGPEMAYDDFERSPGLNRAQMEIVSSRTSLQNECFY
jgi:hypothetical protein